MAHQKSSSIGQTNQTLWLAGSQPAAATMWGVRHHEPFEAGTWGELESYLSFEVTHSKTNKFMESLDLVIQSTLVKKHMSAKKKESKCQLQFIYGQTEK